MILNFFHNNGTIPGELDFAANSAGVRRMFAIFFCRGLPQIPRELAERSLFAERSPSSREFARSSPQTGELFAKK